MSVFHWYISLLGEINYHLQSSACLEMTVCVWIIINAHFPHRIMDLHEGGIIRQWTDAHFEINTCSGDVTISATSVSLDDLAGVFVISCIGLTLSFLVLLMEILAHQLVKLVNRDTKLGRLFNWMSGPLSCKN